MKVRYCTRGRATAAWKPYFTNLRHLEKGEIMPRRPSPPREGDAKAEIVQNKERPIKARDNGHTPDRITVLSAEDETHSLSQAPHTKTPPEILNAPGAPLSPNGPRPEIGTTSSPDHDNPLFAPVAATHIAEGDSSNLPVVEKENEEAPTSKQGIVTIGGIDFHHASEAEFARLLNYYGIEWQYEPHQFPLQWRDGRPVEMFRPDFYLTEYDLYIELTTMRQALVRRKNRKLRLLRALYPEITIKLLYRRDYQRLLERFGIRPEEMDAEAPVAISESREEADVATKHDPDAPQMRQVEIA